MEKVVTDIYTFSRPHEDGFAGVEDIVEEV